MPHLVALMLRKRVLGRLVAVATNRARSGIAICSVASLLYTALFAIIANRAAPSCAS